MKIKLTVEDEVYTLEFTKKTIEAMERGGFNLKKVEDAPHIYIPMFIQGAFRANHASMKNSKIDEIWKHIENKQGLLETLIEMFQEQAESLMDEPEKGDPKKAAWEVA